MYKELQKKQMRQLKETMKEKSKMAKVDEDDKNTIVKVEQDASIEDSTSTRPLSNTPNCDDNTVTVEITMSTLPADEVEVHVFEFSHT